MRIVAIGNSGERTRLACWFRRLAETNFPPRLEALIVPARMKIIAIVILGSARASRARDGALAITNLFEVVMRMDFLSARAPKAAREARALPNPFECLAVS